MIIDVLVILAMLVIMAAGCIGVTLVIFPLERPVPLPSIEKTDPHPNPGAVSVVDGGELSLPSKKKPRRKAVPPERLGLLGLHEDGLFGSCLDIYLRERSRKEWLASHRKFR